MKNADRPAMALTSVPDRPEHNGLSKREYFAAVAMQGLLANSLAHQGLIDPANDFAKASVIYADALLKALEE